MLPDIPFKEKNVFVMHYNEKGSHDRKNINAFCENHLDTFYLSTASIYLFILCVPFERP